MLETARFSHLLSSGFETLGANIPFWVFALVTSAMIIGLVALPFAGLATYVERRIAAFFQDRLGPNRVGPQGILQFPADAIKMISKEDFVPPGADKLLYNLAPVLVVVGAISAFAVLPFGEHLMGGDVNIGVLYVLAVTTMVAPGLLLGSWSSQNKWSLLGGLRGAAQIVSYEVPVALSFLPIILISGTLQVGSIVEQQGWAGGGHFWNIFHNPFTFIGFFILFVAGLAETNRVPFDLPEAESELVSGFNTEFSGMRFGLYALGEFGEVFVMCAMSTALFLGGWHLPFVDLAHLGIDLHVHLFGVDLYYVLIPLIHFHVFMAKTLFLVFVVMWCRWTFPRLRVDQLMGFCWKGLVPVALVNLFGTAIWLWAFHGKSLAQLLMGASSGGGH